MTSRWDNIDLLKAIDKLQQEVYGGGPLDGISGLSLLQQIDRGAEHDERAVAGFVQELSIASNIGLVTFSVQRDIDPHLSSSNPHWYLQNLRAFALSVPGQDRARGRVVLQDPPDPTEDDGRHLSNLIVKQIASAIDGEYARDEVADFLWDEGLPPQGLNADPTNAYETLASLWRWGSEGRRLFRRFAGRWIDDRLLSGPDAELRATLIEQLARQGWTIRAEDSMLVNADPIRGIPAGGAFLRVSRLHPLIEVEARPQFLINKPAQGVFASLRAVEVRVRMLAGLGDEAIGVALMNRAFGPDGPLTDASVAKGEQEGVRALFAGAYAVLRNPAGHREVDYADLSEAAEAVQTASLLMRVLDRVEERLLARAREHSAQESVAKDPTP